MNRSDFLETYDKDPYETPAIVVVEARSEGVICTSLTDYNWHDVPEE